MAIVESSQKIVSALLLGRAMASTRAVLATVGAGQLGAATPCASWDVRALISHFIGTADWAAAVVGGGRQAGDEDRADGGFLAEYDERAEVAVAAFEADGVLEKTFQLPFGERSGEALMNLVAGDQFVHGWDLARAVGASTDLDPELAEELLVLARATTPDELRGPDGSAPFGPAVPAPADACPADRLAAFLGRRI